MDNVFVTRIAQPFASGGAADYRLERTHDPRQDKSATGCVIDADNANFFGRDFHLDFFRLARFLRVDRHVATGHTIAFANHLSGMEAGILRALGFQCIESHKNCDPDVAAAIEHMVREQGIRSITLISGDGGYTRLLKDLKALTGLRVHVIASRRALSKRLRQVADGITWLDAFAAESSVRRCLRYSPALRPATNGRAAA